MVQIGVLGERSVVLGLHLFGAIVILFAIVLQVKIGTIHITLDPMNISNLFHTFVFLSMPFMNFFEL